MTFENRKAFLWLFACLAVAALLLVIVFMPTDNARREAVENRIARMKLDAQSRRMPRSVIRGKPMPGNAWEEYNVALDAAWPADARNGTIFVEFANGDPTVDREKVKKMVAEQMPLLERLRLGAQRADGQYPYDWERGAEMEIPSLLRTRMLANLAVAQASILRESGKPQEAADLLLDLTVFGRDLSTNGPLLSSLIGMAVYQTAFDELRRLILSGKLTQRQFTDLAKSLETVDRDFPALSSMLSNETLSTGLGVLQGGYDGGWQQRAKVGGWRFVAFPNDTMLDAFEQNDAFVQRLGKVDSLNFAAVKKESDAISAEVGAAPNAVVRAFMPSVPRTMEVHRETLAKLRLVRAGTVFRATGEMPTIADPFGANLFFKQEADKSRMWSIGNDGKNQNGAGGWQRGQPDMVLEIPR